METNNKETKTEKTETKENERKMTKGVGTLIYQAPEIINGETNYAIDKTDIYSYGLLLFELWTQKEPYSEAPYDKFSKWELERFVGGGKRLEIPKAVLAEVKELIVKCWDQTPAKRPDFQFIVQTLTAIMDSLPVAQLPSSTSSSSLPQNSSSTAIKGSTQPIGGEGRVPKIHIPAGNLNLIGWAGDISRGDAEGKLKGQPAGTFLIRWSHNTASYVLSYTTQNQAVQHIASIFPGKDGHIAVEKEDGNKAHYESIFEYINAMKESGIISEPYGMSPQEDNYGFTPNLYQMAPHMLKRNSSSPGAATNGK